MIFTIITTRKSGAIVVATAVDTLIPVVKIVIDEIRMITTTTTTLTTIITTFKSTSVVQHRRYLQSKGTLLA